MAIYLAREDDSVGGNEYGPADERGRRLLAQSWWGISETSGFFGPDDSDDAEAIFASDPSVLALEIDIDTAERGHLFGHDGRPRRFLLAGRVTRRSGSWRRRSGAGPAARGATSRQFAWLSWPSDGRLRRIPGCTPTRSVLGPHWRGKRTSVSALPLMTSADIFTTAPGL